MSNWVAKKVVSMVAILLAIGLASGCERGGEASSEGASESEQASPDNEQTKTPEKLILSRITEAGFSLEEGVPFEDDGSIPASLTSGKAEGLQTTHAWVVRKGEGYAQVLVSVFADTAHAAEFAKGAGFRAQDEVVLVIVPMGDDEPTASALRTALTE